MQHFVVMKRTRQSNNIAPIKGFHFDAATHSYFLDGRPMTGVTTILGVLGKPALINWAAKMATEYVGGKWMANIAYSGGEIAQVLEEARVAHTRKKEDAAQKGTDLHALVEEYVRGCIEANNGKPMLAYREADKIGQFIDWAIKENVRFLASERRMYSKKLFVAGTVDIVFEKDGKTYIGDIKTYAKIWDRVPFFQAAGYGLMLTETERKEIAGYCILRLSKDGTFEALWGFDTKGDTDAFLACVTIYRALQAFNEIKVKG